MRSALSLEGGAALALLVAVVATPFVGSNQLTYGMTVVALVSIAGVGLNLLIGQAGQVNFAAGTFMALGGYGMALLTLRYEFAPILALIVSAAITGVFAFLVSIPLLRVQGHYLAVATFTISLAFDSIFFGAQWITGGTAGIAGVPGLHVFGSELSGVSFYVLAWLACTSALLIYVLLANSYIGRAWKALSTRDDVARSLGVPTSRLKVLAFVLSAVFGSVSGSLYVAFTSYISPDLFGMAFVINLFLMLFIGGRGTTFGPVLGAIIVIFAPQAMTDIPPRMQNSVFLAMLLLIILLWPQGILGTAYKSSIRGFLSRWKGPTPPAAVLPGTRGVAHE